MNAGVLDGGFTTAPVQSAVAFRKLLEALARPGRMMQVEGANPPAPLSVAAGVLILTLIDGTTPVYLAGAHDVAVVRDWIRFHTGAPFVGAEQASFAIGVWNALLPVSRFAVGLADYPDRAATLVIEGPHGQAALLTGPGIERVAKVGLPDIAAFAANHGQYPLGWDAFLTEGDQVIGVPRSTKVEGV
jgi:alpha-D-ribose 1-methylphosphonate 5-triphosphate synthase subunit PhnH